MVSKWKIHSACYWYANSLVGESSISTIRTMWLICTGLEHSWIMYLDPSTPHPQSFYIHVHKGNGLIFFSKNFCGLVSSYTSLIIIGSFLFFSSYFLNLLHNKRTIYSLLVSVIDGRFKKILRWNWVAYVITNLFSTVLGGFDN